MSQPKPSYEIRQAQPEDGKTICSLLTVFKLPLDGLEDTRLWVIQSSQGVVFGVVGLEIYGAQGLLRSVAVNKDMQGQEYGTFLVSFAMGEAKREQLKDLFLLTTTAPAFFRKFGFKKERRERVSGGITESMEFRSVCPKTAILMHLKLR